MRNLNGPCTGDKKIFDQTLTVAVTSVVIPIPSRGGDELVVWMKNPGTAATEYSLLPNSSGTNLSALYNNGDNGSPTFLVNTLGNAYWWIVTGGSGTKVQGWATLDLTPGSPKALASYGVSSNGTIVQRESYAQGVWHNAGRPTNVQVLCGSALGLVVGCRIVAWLRTF